MVRAHLNPLVIVVYRLVDDSSVVQRIREADHIEIPKGAAASNAVQEHDRRARLDFQADPADRHASTRVVRAYCNPVFGVGRGGCRIRKFVGSLSGGEVDHFDGDEKPSDAPPVIRPSKDTGCVGQVSHRIPVHEDLVELATETLAADHVHVIRRNAQFGEATELPLGDQNVGELQGPEVRRARPWPDAGFRFADVARHQNIVFLELLPDIAYCSPLTQKQAIIGTWRPGRIGNIFWLHASGSARESWLADVVEVAIALAPRRSEVDAILLGPCRAARSDQRRHCEHQGHEHRMD